MKYALAILALLLNFSSVKAAVLPDNYMIPPKAIIMQGGIINQNINNIKIPTVAEINTEAAKYYDKAKSLGLDSSHVGISTSSGSTSIFKDGTLFGSSSNTNSNLNISDDFLNKLKTQIISSFSTSFGVSDNNQLNLKTFVDMFNKSIKSASGVLRQMIIKLDTLIGNTK